MNSEQNSIGYRIKQRRNELKFTQPYIKELTGISSGNLSEYENGSKLPSALTIITLSKVLNCSTDWILKGESLNGESLTSEELHNLEKFRALPKDSQEELIYMLNYKYSKYKNREKETSSLSNTNEQKDLLA